MGAVSHKPRSRHDGAEPRTRELVAAAQRGDRAAFAQLHRRFASVVHGLLLTRVELGEVDDLVQDVFLRALDRLHTLREPALFPGWLAQITRRRAADHHRRRRPSTEPLPPDLTGPPLALSEASEARRALDAIRSLPESYADLLILRLVEGLSGPEIAARTGLSPGYVRVKLHRGLTRLRGELRGRDSAKKGRHKNGRA